METYGLLGQSLSHSASPALHRMLGDYPYTLFEKTPEELADFLARGSFRGLNVTIPYKKTVLPYLAELSPRAAALGSVNTLLRRADGSLLGDNTDYPGFAYLLEAKGLNPMGKKVLVLGSGGASRTVQALLRDRGVSPIVISRFGPENYDNLSRHQDTDWIINTTPVGMFPGNGQVPLSLAPFPALSLVIDLIYNPLRTALLLEAESRGIPAVGGLSMLAAQAFYSSRLWGLTEKTEADLPALVKALQDKQENIILIGMPGSGKSTLARQLGENLQRPVYDSDQIFAREEGISPEQFIHEQGEAAFRSKESAILARLGALSGAVIATGGGAVTRPENYPLLHQNGRIIWLRRPLSALDISAKPLFHRPDLAALYEERKALYQSWADEAWDYE